MLWEPLELCHHPLSNPSSHASLSLHLEAGCCCDGGDVCSVSEIGEPGKDPIWQVSSSEERDCGVKEPSLWLTSSAENPWKKATGRVTFCWQYSCWDSSKSHRGYLTSPWLMMSLPTRWALNCISLGFSQKLWLSSKLNKRIIPNYGVSQTSLTVRDSKKSIHAGGDEQKQNLMETQHHLGLCRPFPSLNMEST